ncbi:hypothetical protein FOA52_002348 [Chlamydomonas sp. UWO 241]|nr:hypothetical protein FOA52_002348 [Chlamydomonas sp. UWO 241]
MAMSMRSLASSRSSAFGAVAPVRRIAVAPVRAPVVFAVEVEAKLKTRKSCSKRMRVTATGKLVGRHAGKQHFNEKMSRSTIREKSKCFTIETANIPNAMKCMPYAKITAKGAGKSKK